MVLANKTDGLLDPGELEDEADSLERLEQEDLKQKEIDQATDLEEEESFD